ncbi:hypothetical protein EMIT043CA1_120029 [Pseudomonas brassicacearum]
MGYTQCQASRLAFLFLSRGERNLACESKALWEQGLPAMQTPRFVGTARHRSSQASLAPTSTR